MKLAPRFLEGPLSQAEPGGVLYAFYNTGIPCLARSGVITYVDGFNFYFGLLSDGLEKFRWLDYEALSRQLLQDQQTLLKAKYFTANIRGSDREKVGRQKLYLQALATRPQLEIILGRFVKDPGRCFKCGHTWPDWEEKMTDVNIAAELMADAMADQFDTALVLSGDSDLAYAILKVRERSGKRVVAAFPPKRSSHDLSKVTDASFRINRTYIGKSLLENPVILPSGKSLDCPPDWR